LAVSVNTSSFCDDRRWSFRCDGKLLWRYDKPANWMRINISTPIYHDGHVSRYRIRRGRGLARLIKNASGEFARRKSGFRSRWKIITVA
jgi:hypothetical protein